MRKNDTVVLDITAVSSEGYGIGKYDNITVFVPLTAIGDRVKVLLVKDKKTYFFGKLLEVIKKSDDRITNDCKAFNQCGGCVYRHISYEAETEIKYNRAYEAVKRIGKIDLKPKKIVISDNIEGYRNKAQLPFDIDGNFGFFAIHSHRVIPVEVCHLQPTVFNSLAKTFSEYIKKYSVSVYSEAEKSGLVRHLYLRCSENAQQIMAVIVINGNALPFEDKLVAMFKNTAGDKLKSVQININTEDTNVILGEKCRVLYGGDTITDKLLGIKFAISPLSFYQVNREMTEKLYKKAILLGDVKGKIVLDLYCGIGTIGLCAAKVAKKVIGVEIVKEAVENAKFNARLNGIDNAEFYCGDAKSVALDFAKKNICFDAVFLDPPRKGCDNELIKTVANSFSPERIVYVSCDPATLARDLAEFSNNGYKLVEYTPFDLFPRTKHVETVALLKRE